MFFHGDYDPCPVSFLPYGRIVLLKSIQDLWHGILYFQDVNDMRLLLAGSFSESHMENSGKFLICDLSMQATDMENS